MEIPLKQSYTAKKPPLEVIKIRLYSTGAKGKVYTNHIYKSLNHNFGVEIVIRNNTSKFQFVKVKGFLYDSTGNPVIDWHKNRSIPPHSTHKSDYYVKVENFSNLKLGKYKVQFWLNNVKVKKDYLIITYK